MTVNSHLKITILALSLILLAITPCSGKNQRTIIIPQKGAGEKRSVSTLEKLIHQEINRVRKEHNLSTLKWTSDVAGVARKHSKDMGTGNYFAHENKKGKLVVDRLKAARIPFTACAENIFKCLNYPDVVKKAVQEWMDSPGHRTNILNKTVTETGVGIYKCSDKDEYYVTQNFIKRALTLLPKPKKISAEEIQKIFSLVQDSITESKRVTRKPTLSSLKKKIRKDLQKQRYTVERTVSIKGFLKNRLVARLEPDLVVNEGVIINLTEKEIEEEKETFTPFVSLQGYPAVILIQLSQQKIQYVILQAKEK